MLRSRVRNSGGTRVLASNVAARTHLVLYGLAMYGQSCALTLAFITFVLCQFFVLGMQVMVVHWGPAQPIFETVDLKSDDWLLAIAVASSVLLLDEGRKLPSVT